MFLKKLSQNYHNFFPDKTSSPWITNCYTKSLKHKQKLYEKFLKNRSVQNESSCKSYRKLFETIKQKSKKEIIIQKKYCNFKAMPKKNMMNCEGCDRKTKFYQRILTTQSCCQLCLNF